MAVLLFLGALIAIVAFAMVVNRVTGTRASYLDEFPLQGGENELWRDVEADFASIPRTGGALVTSHPRLRRHTVVWTDRRLIVAQQALLSKKRMVTHQLVFASSGSIDADAASAARRFAGGFYGRGFATILCERVSLGRVSGKECVRITPEEASGFALNIREMRLFTDRAGELATAGVEMRRDPA